MLETIVNDGVLHGGTPGDYDPQAALTGGIAGIALFFAFVLGATVWSLISRWWLARGVSGYQEPF